MSQAKDVLKYLQTHKGITSKEAFEKFGATRLSAIIFSLRNQGYKIISKDTCVKNRYGRNTIVSTYSLIK